MKTINIGRSDTNDIVIDNDKKVSRQHCRITLQGSEFVIEDLKSKNGTFVNGWKIVVKTKLKPNDVVKIGDTKLDWYGCFKEERQSEQPAPPKPEPSQSNPPKQEPNPESVNSSNNDLFYNIEKDPEKSYGVYKERIKNVLNSYCKNHLYVTNKIEHNRFSEEIFDLTLSGYENNFYFLKIMLPEIEQLCLDLKNEYDGDIYRLNNYYNYLIANYNAKKCDDKIASVHSKKELSQKLYNEIRTFTLNEIDRICNTFYRNNPILFTEEYSVSPSDCSCWNNIRYSDYKSQRKFYVGDKILRYNIFDKEVVVKHREYQSVFCEKNMIFRYNNANKERCFETVNTLIVRMLMSLPVGNVQFNMIDIDEMDGTCSVFKYLNKKVMRVLYRNDDIRKLYESEESHISNIVQNILMGDTRSLYEHNKVKGTKEPYQFIVIKDFPDGLSSDSLYNLKRIFRNGLRAGVGLILLINEDKVNNSEDCKKALHNININELEKSCSVYDFTENCKEDICYDVLSEKVLNDIVKYVNSSLEVSKEEAVLFSDYKVPQSDWWRGRSAKQIEIPFGVGNERQQVKLKITQESGQNSAVVIGIPGSGKSVFLHALICNAAINYSPDELNMYLIDFSGVEFNTYALHNLPHARVIAPEAEREFGLSILKELVEEGTRRMNLCREYNVSNIVELKEKNPDLYVPRLLVIIDEFQKIFEIDNDNISKEANSKIHTIIQEFRKFGINLILATQKLPSSYILPKDLIANRVVFKSSPNDFSALIDMGGSYRVPHLHTGECIYNSESGSAYDNNYTKAFLVTKTDTDNLLEEMASYVKQRRYVPKHNMLVFRGNEQPDFVYRKQSPAYAGQYEYPNDVPVYLGEHISVSDVDVHVTLRKESGNNILIMGGEPHVAEKITYYAMLSATCAHTNNSASFINLNFLRQDNPLNEDIYSTFPNMPFDAPVISKKDEVLDILTKIKTIIEERRNDEEIPQNHIYIGIYGFQFGRMFDVVFNDRGRESVSQCSEALDYILKNGPIVGVFTILQCDNLSNLKKTGNDISGFNYRVALQMSEADSNKIVDSSIASKLFVFNRPSSVYRAYYRDNDRNVNTKFKPYK